MKESIPAKDKAAPAPVLVLAARPPEAANVRVVARFYRRMKPQRVFPLVVELQGAGGQGGGTPLLVHPVIPGAHVTPQELPLDPATPGCKATFYVTPLAKGRLRDARLDLVSQGRLVQEVPLGMRSVTQRLTWVLAALTLLVPAFLLYFTYYQPLSGFINKTIVVRGGLPDDNAPGAADKPAIPPKEGGAPGEVLGPGTNGGENGQEPGKAEGQKPKVQKKRAGNPRARRPAEGAPPGGAAPVNDFQHQRLVQVKGDPGELLEIHINRHVPDVPAQVKMPWRDEPYETPFTVTKHVAAGLGTAYQYATTMTDMYLSFWVGVGLLGLTLASAVTHRAARGRRKSKPLALGAGGL